MANKKKSKKRKRKSGHYCWSCQNQLPNEKFSGKGHARHLCKVCQKLGKEELEFRSELNNLESSMTWEGIIPKKRRRTFNTFLTSDNPRIRAIAEEMAEEDRLERLAMSGFSEELTSDEIRYVDYLRDRDSKNRCKELEPWDILPARQQESTNWNASDHHSSNDFPLDDIPF